MTKKEFIKLLIKPIIQKVYDEKEKEATFGIIKHFPQVMETLEQLMGPEYKFFISDIEYVAPKPSTFKIILVNQQYFFLTWYRETFQAQVSGKKYYLLNLPEQERASLAIVELLKYNAPGNVKSGEEELDNLDTESEPPALSGPEDIEGLEGIE